MHLSQPLVQTGKILGLKKSLLRDFSSFKLICGGQNKFSHINDPILVVVKELGEEVGELVHLQEIWRESVRMTRSKKIINSSIMTKSSGAATWKEESLPLSSSQFTDVLSAFVAKFKFGLQVILSGGRSNMSMLAKVMI